MDIIMNELLKSSFLISNRRYLCYLGNFGEPLNTFIIYEKYSWDDVNT